MHILFKAFCRAYQGVFRLALPFLPYREPQCFDSVGDLLPLMHSLKPAAALLVTDRFLRQSGLTQSIENVLQKAGVKCVIYDETQPNPTVKNVEDARKLYVENHCGCLIALGGGSAMDCAKVVGARIARPKLPVAKMRGLLRILRRTPLLIAVPTTAGTGSETTLAAVITDANTHHKYPINDFALIPDYAVLDENLTRGLPPQITAATGMDALTHAIEAYIGRSTTQFTRTMAEEAVFLIIKHLRTACENGSNLNARRQMLQASYCAGIAFSRSYVGYVHGIAHSLGGQYGMAHGQANAIILPHMLRLYGPAITHKLARLARKAELVTPDTDNSEAADCLIDWIEEMNRDFGIPAGIPQIREEDIPRMARLADRECNPLYPVPVLMNRKELEAIYRQLMHKEEPDEH